MRLFKGITASVLSTIGGQLSAGAGGYKYAFALVLIFVGGWLIGTLIPAESAE